MALQQLVWSFNGNDYRLHRGFKVFTRYTDDLMFENNAHDEDTAKVTRGVLLDSFNGKNGAHHRIGVDEVGVNEYRTGFHIFASEAGALQHARVSPTYVTVPVLFSRPTAVGVQHNAPIVVARYMLVPTEEDLALVAGGGSTETMRNLFFMSLRGSDEIPLFPYEQYVSPAMRKKMEG